MGINIGESQIFALLYADDIALIADSPEKLQQLIQHVKLWCDKWRLSINTEKTQIVHFRKKTTPRTDLIFIFGDVTLKVVSSYKYLGMVFHEHIDYNACVDILTSSASRALGSVIAKFKTFEDVGFDTFNKLYHSMVVPITDYCSSVWGYGIFTKAASIQNRAICYVLGVHSKAPLAGLQGEVSWITPRYRRHLCKIRFWNRLTRMGHTRLTKKIALWDKSICVKNWSSDMKSILSINKLN